MRTVELKIEDVAFGGKGVAREGGKAVFIPFTIDGETVTARIVREKRKFAEAEVVDIRASSAHRVSPECPYFGRCGGCSYQHIDYEHQLAIKWRQVRDVLQRIGKLKDHLPIRPIVPSPLPYRYRNRVTVHVQDGVVGFFRRDSHRLIEIERCPISMDEVNRALAELRVSRPREGHFTVRSSSGPRVFTQANDAVAKALREVVSQMIPSGQNVLIDAYCGAGFFAKSLLEKFKRVIGIDWNKFAIEAAKQGAAAKETYVAGDLETELNRTLEQSDGHKMVVIVDPPAAGLSANVRDVIVGAVPETLIYVSCNPPTLARDLGQFVQRFTIESVTPLDMFPQTAEIEIAVHLQARQLA